MKKIIFILAFNLIPIVSNAQFRKEMREKIRAYKIAFLTEKLDLTESEAEKFWPIYKVYSKERLDILRQERLGIRKKIESAGGLENISEKDAEDIMKKMEALAKKRYLIKTTFFDKADDFLPYKKLLKLQIAEHEFDKKLLRKFRHGKKRN